MFDFTLYAHISQALLQRQGNPVLNIQNKFTLPEMTELNIYTIHPNTMERITTLSRLVYSNMETALVMV